MITPRLKAFCRLNAVQFAVQFGQFAASRTQEGKASMDEKERLNVTELLDKFSRSISADEVRILLVDGHDSHERHSVLSMARSDCTHLMQPLDSCYG